MAYDWTKGLIKVGNYVIPLSLIQADSYKVVKTVVDLDSWRDENGVLHRNALSHAPIKIEFNTIPMLTNVKMSELMANLQNNMTNKGERRASVTYYIPETDSYQTADMYMPDINFQIYGIFNNVVKYDAVRLAFIGY